MSSQSSRSGSSSPTSSHASSGATTPPLAGSSSNSWEASKAAWLAPSSGWALDGSKDLSHLLKLATAQAHVDVLRPPIVNKLITGQIPLDLHILYLMMLHDVYDTMERALSRHADHPLLASIYNPSILARTQGISEDISYLLDLPVGQDWQSHPKARQYRRKPPSALSTYVNRIEACDAEAQSIPMESGSYVYPPPPAQAFLLLAHAYVRYMGDLNGGQQIKERVAKAYQLEPGSDVGLRFYRFEGQDGGEASPAELGKITASLRKGMDNIGDQLSPEQRAALLQEANHAFELNILLFSSFSENEEKKSNLSVPQLDAAPHIPSPSLEGYAKAANYMPPAKAKELKAERKAARKQDSTSSATLFSLQNAFMLALVVPAFLLARTLLQKFLL